MKNEASPGQALGITVDGSRLLHGTQQEACDAELFALMRGIHSPASRHRTGKDFAILSDSQAAMRRIQSDEPGPRQDMAAKIIELASKLYEQGNITAKWVPGHKGVTGNEIAMLSCPTGTRSLGRRACRI